MRMRYTCIFRILCNKLLSCLQLVKAIFIIFFFDIVIDLFSETSLVLAANYFEHHRRLVYKN